MKEFLNISKKGSHATVDHWTMENNYVIAPTDGQLGWVSVGVGLILPATDGDADDDAAGKFIPKV